MQITASQPQISSSRQQLQLPASLKPAGSQLPNGHSSSPFGASPAALSIPGPQQQLTIAPLNTQQPLHLPATAAQTAASESVLGLYDSAPSGESC